MARNKVHKQRFSSKRARLGKAKGRSITSNTAGVKTVQPMDSKERIRKNAVSQRKRSALALQRKRMGGSVGAPRVIGVIPANESGNTDLVVQGMCHAMDGVKPDTCFPFSVVSKEKKMGFTFMWENQYNDQDCIDIAKVADFLVLALDASQSVQQTIKEIQDTPAAGGDEDDSMVSGTTWFGDIGLCITDFTRSMITALNAQGVPSVAVVLQNLDTFTEKQRQKVLRVHQRYFTSVLPDTTKTFAIIEGHEYGALLRHLQVTKLRSLLWREQHPYLVVEQGRYFSNNQKLLIGGYLRGMPLSSKQLIHLTNHGTYQIESITFNDPASGDPQYGDFSDLEQRESLEHVQANATFEDTEGPTEEDLAYHHSLGAKQIKVPEGVSDYQAAWYDLEENEVLEETPMPLASMGEEDAFVGAEFLSHRTSKTDVDFLKVEDIIRLERMTDEERAAEIQRIRQESEEDAWNPDMVDTPLNLPARQRFAKYRGLKSFSTGKWDPTENLPPHYAYIYKLQGITRIRKAALTKCAEGPVEIGHFVYVTLVGVSQKVWENAMASGYIIASGQLEHEQKWSVLHFKVQKNAEWEEPIKSKTPMLAHIGFRKFYVSPLFSDITASDRTKFARFFHPSENFRLASFFGPVSYQPCPILLFEVPSLEEQESGDSLRLACFGGVLPPDPDLLILKRAVLTGRVATIHKKQIVVKYMFFNEEDVRWFQPVDLHTRMGRRGKIIKAVGTHGLFKAALNDQVMQHDLVCMDLYKRIFPKWTTLPFNISDITNSSNEEV
ncbi:pre-rRNA-processing protein TSR1 [Trypanosoma rangeli]|uniref:Pre-rRNA-processing protein TSR1 n=1 Tax=Trypanosoma rangeli TaxID=5698 RepID=A0A422NAK8_TRYRA|nr:pre-rRNA-processing protein TSR1 [Trypanosoma rangeli]RNF02519.1 pre-rRNA-processing protein TSR1 [Trypanosoma rangeli]|eukprot:RNF02519.1 pre-rRNA-processing protein TSR1 [Trypanosoma rangeli]